MSLNNLKNASHSVASLLVVYVLLGTLTLLCIQARISRVIPQEGPLQYLASATKMVHNRTIRVEPFEQMESVEIEPGLSDKKCLVRVSPRLPHLPVLTVTQRGASRRSYFLRPPPRA